MEMRKANQSGRAAMSRNLRRLVEGAVMVAISQVLSMIILWRLPQGGSVSLDMLQFSFTPCAGASGRD